MAVATATAPWIALDRAVGLQIVDDLMSSRTYRRANPAVVHRQAPRARRSRRVVTASAREASGDAVDADSVAVLVGEGIDPEVALVFTLETGNGPDMNFWPPDGCHLVGDDI